MAKYPRIGQRLKLPAKSKKQCSYCQQRAEEIVHVQVSEFRGDDIVKKVCWAHKGAPLGEKRWREKQEKANG